MNKKFSFSQETIIQDLLDLPAEVAFAGQEAIEARFITDQLQLEINEEQDTLKTLESALYNQYKSGELTLNVKGRVTEEAIRNAIALDDTVRQAKEDIFKKKKILLLAKKDLALKELTSNVITFTKAQSMKSVHSQMLKEHISENLISRLDSIDDFIETLSDKIEDVIRYKNILKKAEEFFDNKQKKKKEKNKNG